MAEGGPSKNDFFLAFGSDIDQFANKLDTDAARAKGQINGLSEALSKYDQNARKLKEGGSPLSVAFPQVEAAAEKIGRATEGMVKAFGGQFKLLSEQITGLTETIAAIARDSQGHYNGEPVGGMVPRRPDPVGVQRFFQEPYPAKPLFVEPDSHGAQVGTLQYEDTAAAAFKKYEADVAAYNKRVREINREVSAAKKAGMAIQEPMQYPASEVETPPPPKLPPLLAATKYPVPGPGENSEPGYSRLREGWVAKHSAAPWSPEVVKAAEAFDDAFGSWEISLARVARDARRALPEIQAQRAEVDRINAALREDVARNPHLAGEAAPPSLPPVVVTPARAAPAPAAAPEAAAPRSTNPWAERYIAEHGEDQYEKRYQMGWTYATKYDRLDYAHEDGRTGDEAWLHGWNDRAQDREEGYSRHNVPEEFSLTNQFANSQVKKVTPADQSAARVGQQAAEAEAESVMATAKANTALVSDLNALGTTVTRVTDQLRSAPSGVEPTRIAADVRVINSAGEPVPVEVVGAAGHAGGGEHGPERSKTATTATADDAARAKVEAAAVVASESPTEAPAVAAAVTDIPVVGPRRPRSTEGAEVSTRELTTAVESLAEAARTVTSGSKSEPTTALKPRTEDQWDALSDATRKRLTGAGMTRDMYLAGTPTAAYYGRGSGEQRARATYDRAVNNALAQYRNPEDFNPYDHPEVLEAEQALKSYLRPDKARGGVFPAERQAAQRAYDQAIERALSQYENPEEFNPYNHPEVVEAEQALKLLSPAQIGRGGVLQPGSRIFSVGGTGEAEQVGQVPGTQGGGRKPPTVPPTVTAAAGEPEDEGELPLSTRERLARERLGPFYNLGQTKMDLTANSDRQTEFAQLGEGVQRKIADARAKLGELINKKMTADVQAEMERVVAEAMAAFTGDSASGLLKPGTGFFKDAAAAKRSFGQMLGFDFGQTGVGTYLDNIYKDRVPAYFHRTPGEAGVEGAPTTLRTATGTKVVDSEAAAANAAYLAEIKQIAAEESGPALRAKLALLKAQTELNAMTRQGVPEAGAYMAALARESSAQDTLAAIRDREAKAAAEGSGSDDPEKTRWQTLTGGRLTFGDSLRRHLGNAIENTIGYSIAISGAEKLKALVEDGIKAQAEFVRLETTLQANGIAADGLRTSILQISSSTAQPIENVTEAAAHLAGVMHNASEITVGTRVAAELANISQGAITATEAAEALIQVYTAFGDTQSVAGIKSVGDQIANLNVLTGVNTKDIAEGTSQIAQEAHEYGLSFNQASTAAAFISQATNEPGEEAAGQLSRVLGTLYKGTVQRTLVKTGIATDEEFRQGDLASVFTSLVGNYRNLAPTQRQMIASLMGQGISARAFGALVNMSPEGVAALSGKNPSGVTADSLNSKYLNTVAGSLKELTEDFENLGTQLQKVGAYDWIEGLAKGIDFLVKSVDELLGLISRFADSNPFTQWMLHLGVLAGEASLALKVLGAPLAAMLGGRGLLAPTAASVAAVRAGEEGAALKYAPLTLGGLTGVRRVSEATRLGLSEEEYAARVAAGDIAARPSLGSRVGRFLIGGPAPVAEAAGTDGAAEDADAAIVKEHSAAVGEATVQQQANTAAVTETTTALGALATAAAEAATASEAQAATSGEAAAAPVVGGLASAEARLAAKGAAEATANEISATRRIVVNSAGEAEAVPAASLLAGAGRAEETAIASRFSGLSSALTRNIGGFLGSLGRLGTFAAIGTLGYEAYKGFSLERNQEQQVQTDQAGLKKMTADSPNAPTTVYAQPKPLSGWDFAGETIWNGVTDLGRIGAAINGNPLDGFGLKNVLPQAGPSDESGNESLAFSLRNWKRLQGAIDSGDINKVMQFQNNVGGRFSAAVPKIAALGGNDALSQEAITRELMTVEQRLLDSAQYAILKSLDATGLRGTMGPTEIAGLATFASSTASATQMSVARNPQAYMALLNGSDVTPGTPQYDAAVRSLGMREVTQRAPSVYDAAQGYTRMLSRAAGPGTTVTVTPEVPGTMDAGYLQEYLGSHKNTGNIADALQTAIATGTVDAMDKFARTYGYDSVGSGEGALLFGNGGGQYHTEQYVYNGQSTYTSRMKAAIAEQQAIVDSSTNILNQAKVLTLPGQTRARVVTEAEAQAAGPDSPLAKAYAKSKYQTYAPGSQQYLDAMKTLPTALQQSGQLQDQLAQMPFQAAQGAAGYYASTGKLGAANGQLRDAISKMQTYMKANNIDGGQSQYWTLMTQIQQNKLQMAQNEVAPQLNQLANDAAATNDAVRKAQDAVAQAYLNLQAARKAGLTGTALGQYTSAYTGSQLQETLTRQSVKYSAAEIGVAEIRDPIGNAQAELNVILQKEYDASHGSTADAGTYNALRQQEVNLRHQLADSIEARKTSALDAAAALESMHGDAVGAAITELSKANEDYNYQVQQYGKNSAAAQSALQTVYQAQQAKWAAELADQNSVTDLEIARLNARGKQGDAQEAARLAVTKIRREMRKYLAHGGEKDTAQWRTLEGEMATAQRQAFDVRLQAKLDTLDFQVQTYKITSAQEIEALQEILKNKKLTLQQQRDIALKIKGIQQSIRDQLTQGGLNIPSDIKLPTAYEVRRSLGSGFGGSQTSVNTVNNNHNRVTIHQTVPNAHVAAAIAQKVVSIINQQTHQGLRSSSSTPRTVPTR